jgi:ankyrin repeat protein
MNIPVLLGVSNDNKDIFNYGLQNGDILTEENKASLVCAYEEKRFDYLEKMLSSGINPIYLQNILQLAIRDNNIELTKYLIDKGVTVKQVSYEEQFQNEFVAVKPVTAQDFDMSIFNKKNVKEKDSIFVDRKTFLDRLFTTTLPIYGLIAVILLIMSFFMKN